LDVCSTTIGTKFGILNPLSNVGNKHKYNINQRKTQ
jgi:hypothetical protein